MSTDDEVSRDLEVQRVATERNLSGEFLSDDWPNIDPIGVHEQRLRELGGDIDNWNPVDELSFSIQGPNGESLDYLAVTHSNNPNHPQFKEIESRFMANKPNIVLYEGQEGSRAANSREEAIRNGGEVAFVQWLANREGVEAKSLDIQMDDWIDSLRSSGYSNDEIAAYHIARITYKMAEDLRKAGVGLEEADSKASETFSESDFPADFKKLLRRDGSKWTWELLQNNYKRITGADLSFSNNNALSEDNYTVSMAGMFKAEADFREEYMVRRIAAEVRAHGRVFAEAGSSHPSRQRAALEQFMR